MHRRLLLLLVCLLALRGWVGEAMAGDMLRMHMAAAPELHATAEAGPAIDCHDGHGLQHGTHHGAAAADGAAAPAGDGSATDDCPTCASCQVCSSVALGVGVAMLAAGEFSQPPPATVPARHPSAERVRAYKPPIS